MKKKIKVWIVSDRYGTFIFNNKPEWDEEQAIYRCPDGDSWIFKVDNSRHLYEKPKEVYFCIEQPSKKTKKSKPWCFIRENKGTIEESIANMKKISSMKQFKKRFPKYHDFRLLSTEPVDQYKEGGWKRTYAVVATTNNKEQRDDIIAFVSNPSVFENA